MALFALPQIHFSPNFADTFLGFCSIATAEFRAVVGYHPLARANTTMILV
jgi:hypothetical protein